MTQIYEYYLEKHKAKEFFVFRLNASIIDK